MYSVYMIRCTCSSKKYVGCTTKTPHTRLLEHFAFARASSKAPLADAIREYGEASFLVELLATTYLEPLAYKLESVFIKELNTLYPIGYNKSTGGLGSPGIKHSTEVRKRMSESRLKGEDAPQSILTESDILEIRRKHALGYITMTALAEEFLVSRPTIAQIVKRKTWRHI